MTDWTTIAELGTAGGTLVLAVATFASVRSANRSARSADRAARAAELSLLEGLRPLLASSRLQDPDQKTLFAEGHRLVVGGGRAALEVTKDVDIWSAALRDPDTEDFGEVAGAITDGEPMTLNLLYGDFEGGQRVISQMTLRKQGESWPATAPPAADRAGSLPRRGAARPLASLTTWGVSACRAARHGRRGAARVQPGGDRARGGRERGDQLVVLHWNVHSWRDPAGQPNLDAVAGLIAAQHPDVVSLTEVIEPWAAPGTIADLASRAGYWWMFVPSVELGTDEPGRGYGNALLTRLPVLAVQQWQLTWPPAVYDGTEPSESRSVALARIALPAADVWAGSTHLPLGQRARAAALGRLGALTRSLAAPWIISGDFNTAARHWIRPGQPIVVAPRPARPTFPARFPRRALDYTIASPGVRMRAKPLRAVGSDHRPVLTRCHVPHRQRLGLRRPRKQLPAAAAARYRDLTTARQAGAAHPGEQTAVTGPAVAGPGGGEHRARPLLRTALGGVLRKIRQAQGRTLADVARAARVSVPYLSELERGRKEASSEVLAAICVALRVELADVLADAGQQLAGVRVRAFQVPRLHGIDGGMTRGGAPPAVRRAGDAQCLLAA